MRRPFSLFAFLFLAQIAHAYPEYSVRYNIVRCTACHLSPTGGGPRTVNGKLFGAHGLELNPLLAQDYVGADFRALFDYPQKPTGTRGGAGIMSGSVSGHVALDKAERVHLVIEHNIAGFSAAPYRDSYALFKFASEDGRPHFFDSLLVGRFRFPFGIVTDEHRTYTRVQSASEWFSMDTGVMLSGTPSDQLHFDAAAFNGEKTAGDSLANGQATRFGGAGNIRYMPGPVLIGASSSYSQHSVKSQSRRATSLYAIASLGRWTNDRVPLSLKAEYVRAHNWNDRLASGFASDPNYVTAVTAAESSGWLFWLDYQLNPRWTFTYKYDRLTPDRDFPADFYDRHGLGFRWVVAANTIILARTEVAQATPPSERTKTASGAQNASYAILQLGF